MLGSIKLQLNSYRLRSMNQHQYSQANSRFLISSSSWLDTHNIHFNIYLHTSSLIKTMQIDFPNLYPYKHTIIGTDLYPKRVVSFFIWPLLGISSLMHILDSFLNPWSKLTHYQTLLVHAKQAIIETNPKSSTHVSFVICQTCLLSHEAMISHNIEAILLISFALFSFAWTRLL
jgi:hypothetical protein